MKIFRDLNKLNITSRTAVTVGTFDGIHLGHQHIFRFLKDKAQKHGSECTVVTFDPHPKKVVGNPEGKPIRILTDLNEKLEFLQDFGIAQIIIIPFTQEFARLSYREFVENVLVRKLKVAEMVVGYDHHFGRNREGGFEKLVELGNELDFTVHRVPPFKYRGEVISSTAIRRFLEAGQVEKVASFMGRYYKIQGTVIRGDGRGKSLGFPTANIRAGNPDKIIPARGVYAVDVRLEEKNYKGMMNIGSRPTFDFDSLTLEVHIFNFDGLIYDQPIEVYFKKFIRNEQKFLSTRSLRSRLEEDKRICENL